MVFDPNAIYRIVQGGGPESIFLLVFFLGLIFVGVLRLKREVDVAEQRFSDQKRLTEDLLIRIDRQQALFERSLDLLERQVLPLIDGGPRPQSRPSWRSSE